MQGAKISSELNGYILDKTIGRGTFGKVKKAIHKLTQEPVAIKILQKQKIKDTSDVQRVSRELHFLKIVRHPAIAQMYEIIETPKMIYIIMEYAVGGEYFDYVMDQKIKNQSQAFLYFSQVLAALVYLHKLRISHRDVKPENMLLDLHKRIKLVDFGLSNMYKNGQKLSTACGSPCYASPEMIKGEQYDPQLTDVWSLGIVLFTSVMAKLPFEDQSTNALYNKIKSGLYSIDKKISSQLKDLLARCININPQKRIRLKEIIEHPWYTKHSQQKQISGIQIGYQTIPVDKIIVHLMANLGFQTRKTFQYVQNNIKNHCTATYYLLLKKQLKSGKGSQMDICSDSFKKQNINPLFHIKLKRYKSMDQGNIFQNIKTPIIFKSNPKKCHSQANYQSEIPKNKRNQSFSLRKQSVQSIYSNESNNKIEKTKADRFFKIKAHLQVKQRLFKEFKETVIKRKSLSISTDKVRQSFKKIDQANRSSVSKHKINISNDIQAMKNFRLNVSNNQNRRQSRFKTDFISQIYCPNRKKSNKKQPIEFTKEKSKKTLQSSEIEDLFWKKKKSINMKKTNGFLMSETRPVRLQTHEDN